METEPTEITIPYPELVRLDEEYLALLDVVARARITFHGADMFLFGMEKVRATDATLGNCPGGTGPYRQFRLEHQGGPTDPARQTGGQFVLDLRPLRPQIEGDRFVYVLGYRSPPGEPGQFRRIKVRCRRGSVKLVHRQGYVS